MLEQKEAAPALAIPRRENTSSTAGRKCTYVYRATTPVVDTSNRQRYSVSVSVREQQQPVRAKPRESETRLCNAFRRLSSALQLLGKWAYKLLVIISSNSRWIWFNRYVSRETIRAFRSAGEVFETGRGRSWSDVT